MKIEEIRNMSLEEIRQEIQKNDKTFNDILRETYRLTNLGNLYKMVKLEKEFNLPENYNKKMFNLNGKKFVNLTFVGECSCRAYPVKKDGEISKKHNLIKISDLEKVIWEEGKNV